MDSATSLGTEESVISISIAELDRRLSETGSSALSPVGKGQPQSSIETENTSCSVSNAARKAQAAAIRAPEKKLTLFALRLAVLEKAATGLGTLGFIWATVVLLGGFAITLDRTDFWFITTILLIEGTRIFSRSHELEWQHQASCSISDVGISSFHAIKYSSNSIANAVKTAFFRPVLTANRDITKTVHQSSSRGHRNWHREKIPTRTWDSADVPLVPLVPHTQWVFLSRNVSKVLYALQILSATACVVLSLMKLIMQNFGDIAKGDTDKRNRKSALLIFYSLALAEALLFLLEKAYWEWNVIYFKILDEVQKECELGGSESGSVATRRFFYDAYSLCVNGSIFDGLKLDMVTFAMDLLASNIPEEQLMGAQMLDTFSKSARFAEDTLQKIGINIAVMERLVEMLNWKDPQEEQIRKSAGEIVAHLAQKKQNSLRVAGIAGAMESIASLLHVSRSAGDAADEIPEKKIIFDDESYSFWTFNHLGLTILKKLARDHDNCGKIGNTRGLLPKIIDCTHTGCRLLTSESPSPSQILTVKRSLQVVKMLASTSGSTGKQLRKEISEIVFTISNIRDILRYGEMHPQIQKLGIEILRNLAIEEDATEMIGATGGVLKELFNIFFQKTRDRKHEDVSISAGAALAMLAFESHGNCARMLKLSVTPQLVAALEDPVLRINAARILRNLCAFSGDECFDQLRHITSSGPTILKQIMAEDAKLQEVMIGLGARVFSFMTARESRTAFKKSGITEAQVACTLVETLKKYTYPSIKVPRMRRFVLEFAIWMMKDKRENIRIFRDLGMQVDLELMMDTISDIESFNIFSGTVGLSRHKITIHSLVESAMHILEDSENYAVYS